jgi:hypothetical protein
MRQAHTDPVTRESEATSMRMTSGTLFATLLLAAANSFAASPSPFEGTWKLNVGLSHFVPDKPPKEVTRTYHFEGDMVTMTINGTRADGSTIAARAQFRLDGKEYHYVGTSPLDTVSVVAKDERTWLSTARKKGQHLSQSTFTVSADGRTLTQQVRGKRSEGGAIDDVQVYERQ